MALNQNNFTIDSIGKSWYSGVTQEFDATWGRLPQFRGDTLHMKFMRAQTAFLDSDLYDLETRRQCVLSFGERILDNPNIKPRLSDWWNFFGVESVLPKLAGAICTLYNDAPYREFSTDTGQQDALTELYDQYNVNLAFKTAYRYALFTNVVVLMPDFEEGKIEILPPDKFRFLGPELWYIKVDYDEKGNQLIYYHVWDKKEHRIVDASGKEISREPNPYGRAPYAVIKLNPTAELYGSGITEATEISVYQNLINFFTTKIGVYQSHSILAAFNITEDELKDQYYGPGGIVSLQGAKIEGLDPRLEYITPQNFALQLEEQKQKRVNQFVMDQGLPAYLVDPSNGNPPSGIAMQVAERQLNEYRKEHIPALSKAEKDLADLLAVGTNKHDRSRSLAISSFSIQYADVETFNDPKQEFEHDKGLAEQGFLSPAAFWQKYTSERLSDDEAYKRMNENKKFFTTSELRSTVGGAQALQALVVQYEAGQISRDAGIAMAINVFQFAPEIAASMFVEKTIAPAPNPPKSFT